MGIEPVLCPVSACDGSFMVPFSRNSVHTGGVSYGPVEVRSAFARGLRRALGNGGLASLDSSQGSAEMFTGTAPSARAIEPPLARAPPKARRSTYRYGQRLLEKLTCLQCEEENMKRNRLLLWLVIAGIFALGLAPKAQAQEKCSVATLNGEYLVTGGAEARLDQRDDPSFPRRNVAVWNFDGQGGLTGFRIQNAGGRISRRDLNATYTMDSDRCVATLTFDTGTRWEIFITRDGSEGAAIRVDTDEEGRADMGTRYLKKR